MKQIQYLISYILLITKLINANEDNIELPKVGQDSIKRKYLQQTKDFSTGIRSLADNSHIPLKSIEYQVLIHNTISEIQMIQEFQNPYFGSIVQAEFYYQIKVSQTIVSVEVHTNGKVLQGIVLDKNKKSRSNKVQKQKIYLAPYVEIIQDLHDIMRMNLGLLSQGQLITITIKYLEELERESTNIWKLTLLTNSEVKDEEEQRSPNPILRDFGQNNTDNKQKKQNNNNKNIYLDNQSQFIQNEECELENQYLGYQKNQENKMSYDWKINGQITSNIEFTVNCQSHDDLVSSQIKKKGEGKHYSTFSLDYGRNTKSGKDFILIINEKQTNYKSRAFLGFDPQDSSSPFVALIRFSPLIFINPDESNSSCKNKKKINQSNMQFLGSSSNQKQNIYEEDEDDSNSDDEEDNKDYEEVSENENKDNESIEKNQENAFDNQDNKMKKSERKLLIVIEDYVLQKNDDQRELHINLMIETAYQLIDKLPQNNIFIVNVLFIQNKQMIFKDFNYITIQNKNIIKEQIQKTLQQIKHVVGPQELPIKTIIQQIGIDDKKIKKSYLLLIGTGNYWNTNEILKVFVEHKNFRVHGIGVGQVQFQLFQRIEQLGVGKSYFLQANFEIENKIESIITDLNAPIFKKFTIIYDNKIVNTMTSLVDNVNVLYASKSYTLYVYFNKYFERLVKYKEKNQIKQVYFTLRVIDDENRYYETKAKIQFNNIYKTNALHKLGANQQIQSFLVNALYKSEEYQNQSLLKQGTSAYEKILQYSMKYQILSELTVIFLVDSEFVSCSKSLDQQIKSIQPIARKMFIPTSLIYKADQQQKNEQENNLNGKKIFEIKQGISAFQNLDGEEDAEEVVNLLFNNQKNHEDQVLQILLNNEEQGKKQKKKQKQAKNQEYQCTLSLNPLKMDHALFQTAHTKNQKINTFREKKNANGQSFNDLQKLLATKKINQKYYNGSIKLLPIRELIFLLISILFI